MPCAPAPEGGFKQAAGRFPNPPPPPGISVLKALIANTGAKIEDATEEGRRGEKGEGWSLMGIRVFWEATQEKKKGGEGGKAGEEKGSEGGGFGRQSGGSGDKGGSEGKHLRPFTGVFADATGGAKDLRVARQGESVNGGGEKVCDYLRSRKLREWTSTLDSGLQ